MPVSVFVKVSDLYSGVKSPNPAFQKLWYTLIKCIKTFIYLFFGPHLTRPRHTAFFDYIAVSHLFDIKSCSVNLMYDVKTNLHGNRFGERSGQIRHHVGAIREIWFWLELQVVRYICFLSFKLLFGEPFALYQGSQVEVGLLMLPLC